MNLSKVLSKSHTFNRLIGTSHKSLISSLTDIRSFSSSTTIVDHIVIGGGPVGGSVGWQLAERGSEKGEKTVVIYDSKDRGAHEDYSRLARLSFDGPSDEMSVSQHAMDLVDLVDEIRSFQSGAPVVPMRPGMLFIASPGTPLAERCLSGESYGDKQFIRREVEELNELYPGNIFNLPSDTLCWSHPLGLCVSPMELADTLQGCAKGYGAITHDGRASITLSPNDDGSKELMRVNINCNGSADDISYDTKKLYVFAGAQSKELLKTAAELHSSETDLFTIPEFDDTYISAISTVRYKHIHDIESIGDDAPKGSPVAQPITLGQLHVPHLCDFQANFSVVAEEMGNVYKTRLSGSLGSETISTVSEMHSGKFEGAQDAMMQETYGRLFGTLFPHLQTDQPLDFNRCVTYRNHIKGYGGTSLLQKTSGSASIVTTLGCYGVGVKFGPLLGEAAAALTYGEEQAQGVHIFQSGQIDRSEVDRSAEAAW